MRVRIILMNRMAFQPRFTWRKGMWKRRGVFFVRKDRERKRLDREWQRERLSGPSPRIWRCVVGHEPLMASDEKWKCCPMHTTEQGPDAVCVTHLPQLHPLPDTEGDRCPDCGERWRYPVPIRNREARPWWCQSNWHVTRPDTGGKAGWLTR
jgi:hypothetical protein